MTRIHMVVAAAFCMMLGPMLAEAHGCLKGAAVGGVVGHVAGRHAVAGAAVGCVVGHHRAKVKEREQVQGQRPGETPSQ